MQILELHTLTSTSIDDLMALMYELDPDAGSAERVPAVAGNRIPP